MKKMLAFLLALLMVGMTGAGFRQKEARLFIEDRRPGFRRDDH